MKTQPLYEIWTSQLLTCVPKKYSASKATKYAHSNQKSQQVSKICFFSNTSDLCASNSLCDTTPQTLTKNNFLCVFRKQCVYHNLNIFKAILCYIFFSYFDTLQTTSIKTSGQQNCEISIKKDLERHFSPSIKKKVELSS